jgi:hypothetical protein
MDPPRAPAADGNSETTRLRRTPLRARSAEEPRAEAAQRRRALPGQPAREPPRVTWARLDTTAVWRLLVARGPRYSPGASISPLAAAAIQLASCSEVEKLAGASAVPALWAPQLLQRFAQLPQALAGADATTNRAP